MKLFYKPYDCDLEEYEGRLASSREIWDDCSHEWSYSTLEGKLIILAGFVQKGGNLKCAIERYAEDRSEIYRRRIHWVIFRYIWRMIMGDDALGRPMYDRIRCLDNYELIRLLAEELKKCVKKTCKSWFDYKGQHYIESCWIVSDEYKYDDTILDQIEREHWRSNPDEPFPIYLDKAKRWDRMSCLF